MPQRKHEMNPAQELPDGFSHLGRADRLGLIVDGENWFPAFADLVEQARRQIVILCWDVDSRVVMQRPCDSDRAPCHLTAILHRALERNPGLTIHLLPWDFAMIYAFEREWLPLFARPMTRHPRLHVHYDDEHPIGASQHQKLLVVDDRTAMVGGFDPSRWRWDHRSHAADDPVRRDPDGETYPPFHDLAFVVTGPIARDLGELARERWQRATGERLDAPNSPADHAPWPADRAAVTLDQASVGLCRTLPAWRDQAEVREVETRLCRLIASARDCLYIENQYFTSHRIGEALMASLEAEDGPEVIVLLPREKDGWLERMTMDVLRARLIERLRRADRHGRLRLFYPAVAGLEPEMVSLHSKLVIGDDREINLGSANTSNRSMGFDSELNLSLLGDRDEARQAIAAMRHELLGEHLGCPPETVARAERESGGVGAAIDRLNRPGEDRWLEPLRITLDPEIDRQVPDAAVIDPERARPPEELIDMFIEKTARRPVRRKAALFAGLIALSALVAALLKFTPLGDAVSPQTLLARLEDLREMPSGTWLFFGLAVLALLAGVPATPLVVVAGLLFGAWAGFGLAYGALNLAALLGFLLGQTLGSEAVRRLAGKRLDDLSRRLARRGILTVFSLRLIPLAPFAVVNLVAGATRLRFRDFVVGSLAGLAPGTAALTIFSDRLLQALLDPTPVTLGMLAGLTLLFVGAGWGLSRWITLREQASAAS